MFVIEALTIRDALANGINYLMSEGIREPSRNGDVIVAPTPVTTVYHHPDRMVLRSPTRNANPFFHVMEAIWMLAGKNDLKFPQRFNQRFGEYSDDGVTLPAAYGHRWRRYFGYDQLTLVVAELRRNPDTRRAVLTMWDGGESSAAGGTGGDLQRLEAGSKDIPCNTHAYFDCRGGKLNMTVCCRSNDIMWGAYGANAVHFSFLMQYLAGWLDVPLGVYRQISNNFHLYPAAFGEDKLYNIYKECAQAEPYVLDKSIFSLLAFAGDEGVTTWDRELHDFMDQPLRTGLKTMFFRDFAQPIYGAWEAHKHKEYDVAIKAASTIYSTEWRAACVEWLKRRQQEHNLKKELTS